MLVTKSCMICGKERSMEVDDAAWAAWQGGMLVQRAFPALSPSEREFLITGIDDDCWETLREPDEDDDDPWDLEQFL